ncbi:family 16 glycosylhydrolase [Roseovarius sp. EL26]|uniref:family 16 glycosylhydrolase n=1 Tax=Roseovarius sp. EL26 TaxID=2126672 RepID=UPI0013C3E855|nr:family 16 glycosylhydrolase [Roseovarius sp. EL26]
MNVVWGKFGVWFILCLTVHIGVGHAQQNFIDHFKGQVLENWQIADYNFTHPKFDTDWRRHQVELGNGINLSLTSKDNAENQFDGASIRRKDKTHFGRYEVVVKPARGAGVITGFFTYTGPYYGTQHDEIDIEFLGKDTTQIHLAWFVDGELYNKFIDLGFDAADRPRMYAFEWEADRLRWYAEGRLIYEHTSQEGPIPQVPGYLYANLWASDPVISSWSGIADTRQRYAANVRRVSYLSKTNCKASRLRSYLGHKYCRA